MMYRILFSGVCCGVITEIRTGKIVLAAPILKGFTGKKISVLKAWVKSKGGVVELLGEG